MRNGILRLLLTMLERNGGNMNGKTLGGMALIGGLIVLGFLAYRFLVMEMIMKLAHSGGH